MRHVHDKSKGKQDCYYEDEDVLQLTHILQQAELIWRLDWEEEKALLGEVFYSEDEQPELAFYIQSVLPGDKEPFQRVAISAPSQTASEESSLGCQAFLLDNWSAKMPILPQLQKRLKRHLA